MSDYEDDAQLEQLRRWWRENWLALVGGLVLGLAGIFGWEAWQSSRDARAERASHIYEDLQKLPGDRYDDAVALAATLADEYAGTPYAAQGALLIAARAAERGAWDTAQARLEWVVENAGEPGLKKIGRLRLARVLWQRGQLDEALARLEIEDTDAFAALYQELRGDIQLAKGDAAAARNAYEKALQLGPGAASRDGLQRKLDDLAGAAS